MSEIPDFYRNQANTIENAENINLELEKLRLEIELEKLRLQKLQIEQGHRIEVQNNNIDFSIIK
jgi:hypothetical protein